MITNAWWGICPPYPSDQTNSWYDEDLGTWVNNLVNRQYSDWDPSNLPGPKQPYRSGWVCPKCGRSYSPDTLECQYCNTNIKITC